METYVGKFKSFKPLEKNPKINECKGTFIPDSRVNPQRSRVKHKVM